MNAKEVLNDIKKAYAELEEAQANLQQIGLADNKCSEAIEYPFNCINTVECYLYDLIEELEKEVNNG